MKKKTIAIIVSIVVLGIIGILAVLIVQGNKNKEQLVYVSNWDGMENRYAICAISGEDSITTYFGECWTGFKTDMTLDEIAETNKADFVKDIVFGEQGLKKSAKLFFNNNNYYVIYCEEGTDTYFARCCCAVIEDGGIRDVYVPMPVHTIISDEIAGVSKAFGENLVDELYGLCSFEEACEFYERYTNNYITIDKENQTITVPGYKVQTNSIAEDYLIMDWKNKTYTYTDSDGKIIIFDGK